MTWTEKARDLVSVGGGARILTWVWVLTWAQHAITTRDDLLVQVVVAVGGVVMLVWEALHDRLHAWSVVPGLGLLLCGLVLAGTDSPRDSGYLLGWGVVVLLLSASRARPALVVAAIAAPLIAAILVSDSAALLVNMVNQFLVVYLLQRLAQTARELRRTQDQLARSEVDTERERLAGEINTMVGATLVDVSAQTAQARIHFARDDRISAHLAEVEDLVEHGLTQLAQLSQEPVIDTLDAELHTAQTLCRRLGVQFTESVDDVDVSVTPTFALLLREAVTNMFKHAQPTRCTVVVRQVDRGAVFMFTNDGTPEGKPAAELHGSGQDRMRTQIAAVEGEFEAGPLTDGRYRVVVRVPTPVRVDQGSSPIALERNSHG
ncbi:sensor histidine kinase [Demetria terragena]|uniref:sensor histidine kinase n=1 Tax=Demetria terragena TaxID=63959 RepID=UPI000361BFA6|nr:hypothetical protein [Demetria terragena]